VAAKVIKGFELNKIIKIFFGLNRSSALVTERIDEQKNPSSQKLPIAFFYNIIFYAGVLIFVIKKRS